MWNVNSGSEHPRRLVLLDISRQKEAIKEIICKFLSEFH